jgi:hypothetical protein
MKLKIQDVKFVELDDWNRLVVETYGRRYNFQQQNGCKPRGIERITVPDYSNDWEDELHSSIENNPDVEIGFKFDVWLKRDPKQPIPNQADTWELDLFWKRNFYPHINSVANDLFRRGLIDAGNYVINIDW